MKKFLILVAAMLTAMALLPDEAFAQRGRGGGVYRGGGGFRAVGITGGYRGGFGGYRGGLVGRGYPVAGYRGGLIGRGYRVAGYRGGYYGRYGGAYGAYYGRYGGHYRRHIRRAFWPVVAAAGFGYYGYPYYAGYADPYYGTCVAWTGYGWVNICY